MNEKTPNPYEQAYSAHKESANELAAAREDKGVAEELSGEIATEAELDSAIAVMYSADQRLRGAEENYRRVLEDNSGMISTEMVDEAEKEMVAALQQDVSAGTAVDVIKHPEEAKQTPEAMLKADFDRVIGKDWETLPKGVDFSTKLAGVDSIAIVGPKIDRATNAWVMLKRWDHDTGNDMRMDSFEVTKDGHVFGALSDELREKGITKDDVLREMIRGIETSGVGSWSVLEAEILPPDRVGERPESIEDGAEQKQFVPVVDPERLKNLQRFPGFVTGFVGKRSMASYYGLVFDRFVAIEHPVMGNAAFVFDLNEPIDRSQIPSDPHERSQWLSEQPWVDLLRQPRSKFIEATGATKIVHRGNWKERFNEEIERRLGQTQV